MNKEIIKINPGKFLETQRDDKLEESILSPGIDKNLFETRKEMTWNF